MHVWRFDEDGEVCALRRMLDTKAHTEAAGL